MIKESEYGSYYRPYIEQIGNADIVTELSKGREEIASIFRSMPDQKQEYAYASGKWTPKEILLHLIDCERVFMYRAMQIARSKNVDLAGFDQDEFVANSAANARTMESLVQEFDSVRSASLAFINSCNPETLLKIGKASNSPLSVRAAAYITRGHELHHVAVLKEKYL